MDPARSNLFRRIRDRKLDPDLAGNNELCSEDPDQR